jgi:hypothetical protein
MLRSSLTETFDIAETAGLLNVYTSVSFKFQQFPAMLRSSLTETFDIAETAGLLNVYTSVSFKFQQFSAMIRSSLRVMFDITHKMIRQCPNSYNIYTLLV